MHRVRPHESLNSQSLADRAGYRPSANRELRAQLGRLLCAGLCAAAVSAPLMGSIGCVEPAPTQEWTPTDHDNRRVLPTRRQMLGSGHEPPSDSDQLTEVTWKAQCAGCHGAKGRGDGPMSAMVQAKDLSAADWQDSVSDAAIAEVVKKGKGRMPAVNLPDKTIEKLIALVRTFRRPGSTRGVGASVPPGAVGQPSRIPPQGH